LSAVAVSDDLLDLGLVRGTRVRIEGLPGEFTVLDRMHSRWRRSIDIYMGKDIDAALNWGRRDVRIFWQTP
jgi:3D (Asp-Asp-Asp) domain-containing protein